MVNTCHRPPAETPSSPCIPIICGEDQVDGVASTCDYRWQGGGNTLASDHNAKATATALLHQSRPVAVHDCQVVIGTVVTTVLSTEGSKLYGEDQPLLHLDRVSLRKVVRIATRVIW